MSEQDNLRKKGEIAIREARKFMVLCTMVLALPLFGLVLVGVLQENQFYIGFGLGLFFWVSHDYLFCWMPDIREIREMGHKLIELSEEQK